MIRHPKVKTLEEIESVVREARSRGKKVVFGNGAFDLLHVGHIRYLRGARALGDLLIVGVNDDASVRKLKDEGRPVFPLEERLEILSAMASACFISVIAIFLRLFPGRYMGQWLPTNLPPFELADSPLRVPPPL